MSSVYLPGDRINITIKGTVRDDGTSEHCHCQRIEDERGNTHFVFLATAGEGKAVEVERVQSFRIGKVYVDADGDPFERTADGWKDKSGYEYSDSYPTKPMTEFGKA